MSCGDAELTTTRPRLSGSHDRNGGNDEVLSDVNFTQPTFGSAERRHQHHVVPAWHVAAEKRDPASVRRPHRAVIPGRIDGSSQLRPRADALNVDVGVVLIRTGPRERNLLAVGRQRRRRLRAEQRRQLHLASDIGRYLATPRKVDRRERRRHQPGHPCPPPSRRGTPHVVQRCGTSFFAHAVERYRDVRRVSRRSPWLRRPFHLGDEPIPPPRKRLDEPRFVRRVVEGIAQPTHRRVQARFEVYEGVGGPETMAEILAGDQLARPFQQSFEDLERLVRDFEARRALAKFGREPVKRERAEPNDLEPAVFVMHGTRASPP